MKNPIPHLAVMCAALLLVACSKQEPVPEPVRAVRTVTVTSETAGGRQEFAAEVRARVESRLGFQVGGKLLKRSAELGQRVKQGDTLAQLDAQDLMLGQEAARAGVRAARVNFDLALADVRRYRDLREQGFISAAELERRESGLRGAQAQLDQAQAQAGVQSNQAGYTTLRAAASGVITSVEAEPGAVLPAGAPVVRLAHDGPRDVVFSLPEDSVGSARALLGREGALRVRIWGSTQELPATLRELAASADPASRTFQAKADLGKAPVQLGQTATVLIDTPGVPGLARLPLTAVMQQQGKTAVWVVDKASMTVKMQPVQVGGADGNSVLIAGGLNPGQQVVTAGVHVLTAGQKVKHYQAPGSAASSPADSR